LLADAIRPFVKAGAVPLAPEMPASEAFRQIVQACLVHFRLNEDLLFPARMPEPLHQARVALRRMRSAFTIFRPVIGSARELPAGLRQLAMALGAARERSF
ncbi:CHAD domain-containing protein, partial [Staphylococcus pseudintermedius]|uniref:CHAD domain-containing protein n=1 Tax=Staphylococcus pseudintermedius TaxID=283734 RepID=UPI000E382EAC